MEEEAAADRLPGWTRRTGAAVRPTGRRRSQCRRGGRCAPAAACRTGTDIQRSPRTGTVAVAVAEADVVAAAAVAAAAVAVAAAGPHWASQERSSSWRTLRQTRTRRRWVGRWRSGAPEGASTTRTTTTTGAKRSPTGG